MGRSLALGIALSCAWLPIGCGSGVLSGGDAGSLSGSAGAGGGVVPTGAGGGFIPTGAGGDWFAECLKPQPALALPPNFLIALDTSAAMNDVACAAPGGCDTPSKWAIAVNAINATTAETQGLANWGLELFSDGTNTCGTDNVVDVPFGLGAAQGIAVTLASRTAGGRLANLGQRSTRSAVVAANRYLSAQTAINRSFIVLLTTGVPGCAVGTTDPLADDTSATADALSAIYDNGFPTIVIGLGELDTLAQASLLNLAAAGGYFGYWAALTSADVQETLRSFVIGNSGCTFALPPPPNDLATRERIAVSLGEFEIPHDANDGWGYTDATHTSIQLNGMACDAAKADRTLVPVIRFLCPLI